MQAIMIACLMSERSHPKYSFSKRVGESEFLNVAVWPGKSNPKDEVISIQLRRFDGDWTTAGRIALYRLVDGVYSELPENSQKQPQQQQQGDD